ncbi:MAG: asparagine--tRNA ligase [Mollicutes bacterium PWAP]|nr:asparagine--tRNA ligase [Mollicutes bacterium PWAP]
MFYKELLKTKEKNVEIKGWVKSIRGNKKIKFIEINDGSIVKNIQIIAKGLFVELVEKITTGSSATFKGKLIKTPNGKQPFEIILLEININSIAIENYPIQKKEITLDTLRKIPQYRHRTNLLGAVMRIRSSLSYSLHNFFYKNKFIHVHTPILTGVDSEGAGETFEVTTNQKSNFFNKKASLTVSGQLHAETYASGLGDVYTFGPTFRAENSHTTKHASEFWMLETEMEFTNYKESIKIAFEMLNYSIKFVLENNKEDMDYLNDVNEGLFEKLNLFLENGIQEITYSKAIEILIKNKDNFEIQDIKFGTDLSTEHENFLAEKIFKGPVALVDYPQEIKSFYMKLNKDEKTVAAFDILAPGIGELIGGSQREDNINKIKKRIDEVGVDKNSIDWYVKLRENGHGVSSGYGLGFERLIMYVTGMKNIRDVIPYPRTPKNMEM